MNAQKQQNHNRNKIDCFFQLRYLILFTTLISIIGCSPLEENSGKLEVMGKTYLLDCLFITNPNYGQSFFEFGSSEAKISVQFQIYNLPNNDIPIGTFKRKENPNSPVLSQIHVHFVEDRTIGICEDEATLKISQSNAHINFTLKGKMRFGENLSDFKLTYKM